MIDTRNVVMESNLKKNLLKKGKVRDVYDLGDKILIVSTDRISAFDIVLPTGIPHKGEALNLLSAHWFEETKNIVPNHYVEVVDSRTSLALKAKPLRIEFIVRGYIYGSSWTKYKMGKPICGIKLPKGLQKAEKMPYPILTPTTKANVGHDAEMEWTSVIAMIGKKRAESIEEYSLKLYDFASKRAESRGIIIADTKFEFGLHDDQIMLIDEVLTPDSSRFWPMERYTIGNNQLSFDKQYVRDYLSSLNWNKKSPAPNLPEEIVVETSRKYIEAYERLTGKKFSERPREMIGHAF